MVVIVSVVVDGGAEAVTVTGGGVDVVVTVTVLVSVTVSVGGADDGCGCGEAVGSPGVCESLGGGVAVAGGTGVGCTGTATTVDVSKTCTFEVTTCVTHTYSSVVVSSSSVASTGAQRAYCESNESSRKFAVKAIF